MAYDDLFKQLFKAQYGDAVQSEIAVGALEKSFDLWLQGDHPSIQDSDLIPTAFKQHTDNIIEYKSGHDQYQMYDIFKLLGDFSYFSYNPPIGLEQRVCKFLFVVSNC